MQQLGATRSRSPVAAAVALAALACASAAGAEPSSVVALQPLSNNAAPEPFGVSGDGSTVFGRARVDDSQGASLGLRPAKWNALGEATPLAISADDALQLQGTARAASFDGTTVVGQSDEYEEGA